MPRDDVNITFRANAAAVGTVLDQISRKFSNIRRQIERVNSELDKFHTKIGESTAGTDRLKTSLEGVQGAARGVRDDMTGAARAANGAGRQATRTGASFENANRRASRSGGTLTTVMKEAQTQIGTLSTSFRRAAFSISTGSDKLDILSLRLDAASMMAWKFQMAVVPLRSVMYGALGGVVALGGALYQLLNTAERIEGTRVQFQNIRKSAKTAEQDVDFLVKKSTEIRGTVDQTLEAGRILAVSGLDIKKWINPIADLQAGLNQAGIGMESAARAVVDGIHGEFRRLRNTFDITKDEVKRFAGDAINNMGQVVDRTKVEYAIMEAILKKYGGSNKAAMGTLSGQWSNFRDIMIDLFNTLGRPLVKLAQKYLPMLAAAVKWLSDVSDTWVGNAVGFVLVAGFIGSAFTLLGSAVGILILQLKGLMAMYQVYKKTGTSVYQAIFKQKMELLRVTQRLGEIESRTLDMQISKVTALMQLERARIGLIEAKTGEERKHWLAQAESLGAVVEQLNIMPKIDEQFTTIMDPETDEDTRVSARSKLLRLAQEEAGLAAFMNSSASDRLDNIDAETNTRGKAMKQALHLVAVEKEIGIENKNLTQDEMSRTLALVRQNELLAEQIGLKSLLNDMPMPVPDIVQPGAENPTPGRRRPRRIGEPINGETVFDKARRMAAARAAANDESNRAAAAIRDAARAERERLINGYQQATGRVAPGTGPNAGWFAPGTSRHLGGDALSTERDTYRRATRGARSQERAQQGTRRAAVSNQRWGLPSGAAWPQGLEDVVAREAAANSARRAAMDAARQAGEFNQSFTRSIGDAFKKSKIITTLGSLRIGDAFRSLGAGIVGVAKNVAMAAKAMAADGITMLALMAASYAISYAWNYQANALDKCKASADALTERINTLAQSFSDFKPQQQVAQELEKTRNIMIAAGKEKNFGFKASTMSELLTKHGAVDPQMQLNVSNQVLKDAMQSEKGIDRFATDLTKAGDMTEYLSPAVKSFLEGEGIVTPDRGTATPGDFKAFKEAIKKAMMSFTEADRQAFAQALLSQKGVNVMLRNAAKESTTQLQKFYNENVNTQMADKNIAGKEIGKDIILWWKYLGMTEVQASNFRTALYGAMDPATIVADKLKDIASSFDEIKFDAQEMLEKTKTYATLLIPIEMLYEETNSQLSAIYTQIQQVSFVYEAMAKLGMDEAKEQAKKLETLKAQYKVLGAMAKLAGAMYDDVAQKQTFELLKAFGVSDSVFKQQEASQSWKMAVAQTDAARALAAMGGKEELKEAAKLMDEAAKSTIDAMKLQREAAEAAIHYYDTMWDAYVRARPGINSELQHIQYKVNQLYAEAKLAGDTAEYIGDRINPSFTRESGLSGVGFTGAVAAHVDTSKMAFGYGTPKQGAETGQLFDSPYFSPGKRTGPAGPQSTFNPLPTGPGDILTGHSFGAADSQSQYTRLVSKDIGLQTNKLSKMGEQTLEASKQDLVNQSITKGLEAQGLIREYIQKLLDYNLSATENAFEYLKLTNAGYEVQKQQLIAIYNIKLAIANNENDANAAMKSWLDMMNQWVSLVTSEGDEQSAITTAYADRAEIISGTTDEVRQQRLRALQIKIQTLETLGVYAKTSDKIKAQNDLLEFQKKLLQDASDAAEKKLSIAQALFDIEKSIPYEAIITLRKKMIESIDEQMKGLAKDSPQYMDLMLKKISIVSDAIKDESEKIVDYTLKLVGAPSEMIDKILSPVYLKERFGYLGKSFSAQIPVSDVLKRGAKMVENDRILPLTGDKPDASQWKSILDSIIKEVTADGGPLGGLGIVAGKSSDGIRRIVENTKKIADIIGGGGNQNTTEIYSPVNGISFPGRKPPNPDSVMFDQLNGQNTSNMFGYGQVESGNNYSSSSTRRTTGEYTITVNAANSDNRELNTIIENKINAFSKDLEQALR